MDLQLCEKAVAQMKARRSSERVGSEIFIVGDIGQLGQRTEWILVLHGGKAATVDYVTSQGRKGLLLSYHPGHQIPRKVWASTNFTERHRVLHDIIDSSVQSKGSRWSWFEGTLDEFLVRSKNSKNSDVIALVTPGDKRTHSALSTALSMKRHVAF